MHEDQSNERLPSVRRRSTTASDTSDEARQLRSFHIGGTCTCTDESQNSSLANTSKSVPLSPSRPDWASCGVATEAPDDRLTMAGGSIEAQLCADSTASSSYDGAVMPDTAPVSACARFKKPANKYSNPRRYAGLMHQLRADPPGQQLLMHKLFYAS